jgi:hypothetical protein
MSKFWLGVFLYGVSIGCAMGGLFVFCAIALVVGTFFVFS